MELNVTANGIVITKWSITPNRIGITLGILSIIHMKLTFYGIDLALEGIVLANQSIFVMLYEYILITERA